MGPCGCCPPRGRGDPRGVGRSPPGRWLWRAEGLPPPLPPSAAPCEEVLVLALLWLLSVLSWALPIPGAFSSPVSGDLGLGGGALGAPHSPLLGGRRAPVPVLQGGAAMRHLVFSSTTTVKHWGLVGNKKGLFIHCFWGFGGSAATSFPPPPGSESPPQGSRAWKCLKTSPSWYHSSMDAWGRRGQHRGAVSPCPSPGGCWSPPGPGGLGVLLRPAPGGGTLGAILQPCSGTNAAPCRRPSGAACPCGLSSSASCLLHLRKWSVVFVFYVLSF